MSDRWSVFIRGGMGDFVTGRYAEMIFITQEDAERYIESSKAFHPGRFTYSRPRLVQIKETL